jgi:hypothetical protein
MGAGELARAPKASCFKELFPIIRRLGGELRPQGENAAIQHCGYPAVLL